MALDHVEPPAYTGLVRKYNCTIYLILKNNVIIPTISFYNMNAIQASWMLFFLFKSCWHENMMGVNRDFGKNINKSAIFPLKPNNIDEALIAFML